MVARVVCFLGFFPVRPAQPASASKLWEGYLAAAAALLCAYCRSGWGLAGCGWRRGWRLAPRCRGDDRRALQGTGVARALALLLSDPYPRRVWILSEQRRS